ncbi:MULTISPECIES: 15-cis-phytoene synthase CrtB [Pantoea]|uniref:15-cis-phytoene synthase n=2 Tax=Pantoea stewartii TaxID=66269 RepID=H3RKJ2_PANSE|nr:MULTISPECIES: 15-cis-phytoene synthase CrtB [Pantoea]ARF52661.1 phytoene synthase [Pantoea stewartii subsp. stewartii DC283]EHT98233.1 phytoene synthase [Pantoea stewartii subsp. stewartii DC283]KAB0559132.1 phytoene/squalene synthase family protein [Pantoea stewartii subsp. stewartii]KGD79900.1 phytoene synthase [Pantoea stewartii subsp. indologenes]TDS67793.1 phytoene synthase [Pantoea sp. PNA 14-12]
MTNTSLLNHAVETMAVGSKSFATASTLFDAKTRRSVLMLYAWCRHCDDVIDDQTLGFHADQPSSQMPEQRLQQLEMKTRQAYAGSQMHEPAFAAFQEVAMAHDIAPAYAFDHLEGFAMDVRETRYLTLDDTLRYCYHVAGVVGLMMAQIMGVRDNATLDRACDLGLAFQLTNIARDIVDDAQVGRCYLPESWLEEEGLTKANYAAPENRQALSRIAGRLVREAEPYYVSSMAGLAQLPLRSAWAIATAKQVYRKIGVKVEQAGKQAWDHRQSTSTAEKLTLLLTASGQAVTSRMKTYPPRPAHLWQRPI